MGKSITSDYLISMITKKSELRRNVFTRVVRSRTPISEAAGLAEGEGKSGLHLTWMRKHRKRAKWNIITKMDWMD